MGVYNVAIKVGDEMMEDFFYEILDENMEVTQEMTFNDLKDLNEEYSS